MKPTTLVIALAGLTTSVLAASPDHGQQVLQAPQEHRQPAPAAPLLKPQRASSPPLDTFPDDKDAGLRVPIMKAEAGKGARDAKLVILGVAGAAGLFALGLL